MVDVSVTATSSDQNLTDSPHYLAETLIKNGVKHMYGVVGIPVTDFARIAQGMGIRFIGMRHEEDAVNAAAAEGFLTGRPAVALTVSAPGFLNGLAPLLEATTNGFPVIMIGGSSTRHVVDMHEGEYEGLDQMNYAKQFCKESFRIDKIEDIPLAVARAMHIACSGRPGGVYIDFPDDAVAQTLDKDVAESQLWVANQPAPAMPPAQSSVDEALKLLSEAKNPLMLVGKGAALAQAEDELREFVEKTDMPFQPMSMAKGVIPDDDPHCTASCRGLALRTADVVLLVGARLNWMLNFGEGKEWNPNVKFIQIDIDPNEIENARSIACPVVGDIKSAMQMINAGLEKTPVKASAQWLDMLKADAEKNDAKFAARVNSNTVPMGHYDALGAIKKVYDQHKDMILTNEGANTLDDCRNIIDIYQPRHRLDCGTWGVMGCAVGYSIGAQQRRHLPRRFRESRRRRRPVAADAELRRPLRAHDRGVRRQRLLRDHPGGSRADGRRGRRLRQAEPRARAARRLCGQGVRAHLQPEPEARRRPARHFRNDREPLPQGRPYVIRSGAPERRGVV